MNDLSKVVQLIIGLSLDCICPNGILTIALILNSTLVQTFFLAMYEPYLLTI